MSNFAKSITALLLAFVILCVTEGSILPKLGQSSADVINQAAFDDFISQHISFYRDNMKEAAFPSPDFNFTHDSAGGNTANVSTTSTFLQDIRMFAVDRVESSIDLANRVGFMHIEFSLGPVNISGSYQLEGVASSVIIVNGDGPYSLQSERSWWTNDANFTINSTGYATVTWAPPSLESYYTANATFEGIVGEDVIGELIQDYLTGIGSQIFRLVHPAWENYLSGSLGNYISNVLQTITIEEILYGPNPTTPTSGTSPTPNPTTSSYTATNPPPTGTTNTQSTTSSSTMRPDLTVDVGSDLAGSGWDIPTILTCGYATNLNGFFCNGDPVLIRDPFPGTGFWMSPCLGRCTFRYDNVLNGNSFATLGIRAYYSDFLNGSRILVDFEHDSGMTHLEFVKTDGDYNEIDFRQYGTLHNINVTMEHAGSGSFAVLDRLTVAFN